MKNVLLSKLTKLALVSGLLFFACTTKASAEVNMKVLNSVIKSCQNNPPKDNSVSAFVAKRAEYCITERYNYTLFMSKYNGLKNLGDLRPGFPSYLALYYYSSHSSPKVSSKQFLDCMVSQDSTSNECRRLYSSPGSNQTDPVATVCSSCFNAYINARNNINVIMVKDLITWFYALDKPSRKLVADSLSDPDFIRASHDESWEAFQLYSKIKEKVERETQEQKYRDLLQ